MPPISRRKALGHLSATLCAVATAGCGMRFRLSENHLYVYASITSAHLEEWEITEYSHERVQANEFARELVPKAAETGSARKRATDAGRDAIDGLPTRYIRYEGEIVLLEMLHEE